MDSFPDTRPDRPRLDLLSRRTLLRSGIIFGTLVTDQHLPTHNINNKYLKSKIPKEVFASQCEPLMCVLHRNHHLKVPRYLPTTSGSNDKQTSIPEGT